MNAPGAERLSFGAAVRLSDYSTVGSTNAWKLDAVYAPVESFTFRATYAQAVRAPNISELFSPESTTFHFITDPCDINELNNGTGFREANCAAQLTELGIDPGTFLPSDDPSASLFTEGSVLGQYRSQRGDGDHLDGGCRVAAGTRAGLEPVAGLVRHRNRGCHQHAGGRRAGGAVRRPTLARQPVLRRRTRDAESGFITGFSVQPDNVTSFRTAGLDVALDYRIGTDKSGDFQIQLVGGYLDRLEFIATPGADLDSDLEEQYYRNSRRPST